MKLFTKQIDTMLFKQYPMGNSMGQKVVAKIFNPYGRGRWYLMNSDPNDPDYLWGIVQMGNEVEIGSISRRELENIRFSAFRLPLERDLSFSPMKASDVYEGLKMGKVYKKGGFVEREANKDMLLNYAQEFKHHSTEFSKAAKESKEVMPWVIAKAERASTDLSDITHYLDGENSKYAEGGITNGYYETMANGGSLDGKLQEVMKDAQSLSANQKLKTYVFDYEFDRYNGRANEPHERYSWGYQDDVDYFKEKGFDSFMKVIAAYDKGVPVMANGGDTDEGVDLFEDYDNIPPKVQKVLDKYSDDFEDGNYDGLGKALKELNKIGYTFEFYLDGQAYDLRKIGQKGKSEADSMMAKGGKTEKEYKVGDEVIYAPNGKFFGAKNVSYIKKAKVTDIEEISGKKVYTLEFKNKFGQIVNSLQTHNSKEINLDPDVKMADGGMMARGGEIEEIGKAITEEYGISKNDGQEYGSISKRDIERILRKEKNRFLRYKGSFARSYDNSVPFLDEIISDLKKDGWIIVDSNTMANGGIMAKGGAVSDIDMAEVESSAKYYTDESRWSKKPTIEKFKEDIREYEELKRKLDNKEITPSKIIGTGIKPNLARPLAYRWLNERTLVAKRAIEILQGRGQKMMKGGKVTFEDKVKAISKRLIERKKVSPSVQKDYGKTYSKKEAQESARRIVGAMKSK